MGSFIHLHSMDPYMAGKTRGIEIVKDNKKVTSTTKIQNIHSQSQ
jgi:uncharacterized protein YuzE